MLKFNDESLHKGAESLKRRIDGEPKNVNPLLEIPTPEMRLYVLNGNYFNTKEDLDSYCMNQDCCYSIGDAYILEYIRCVAGRNDVIRKINSDGRIMLYTAVDRFGYGMYNYERSFYRGQYTWEFNYGSIRELYIPFRDRGIIFEDNVYGKIEEKDKELIKMIRENHLFNL